MTTVKITCACRTRAASPGVSPASMATYSRPNWPSDMNRPTAATVRQGAAGRGTRKTAGSTTTVNRMATNRSGGTSCIPQSMTTKLKPHTVATSAASRESRPFTGPAWRGSHGNTSE